MKKEETSQAVRLLNSYRVVYRELYGLCCAITGREGAAQNALLDAMLASGPFRGRRSAFAAARRAALASDCTGESDLSYFEEMPGAEGLLNESNETRRIVMLVCAAGLTKRQAASVMDVKTGKVGEALLRAASYMPGETYAQRLKNLEKLSLKELKNAPYAPDAAAFERALENRMQKEADKNVGSVARKRLFSRVVSVAMLLLIGFLLWVGSIMLNYFRESAMERENEPQAALTETDGSDAGTDQ